MVKRTETPPAATNGAWVFALIVGTTSSSAADFAQLCGGTDNAIEALEAAEAIYEAMREGE